MPYIAIERVKHGESGHIITFLPGEVVPGELDVDPDLLRWEEGEEEDDRPASVIDGAAAFVGSASVAQLMSSPATIDADEAIGGEPAAGDAAQDAGNGDATSAGSSSAPDYDSMELAELRERAKSLGIAKAGQLGHDKLLAALKAQPAQTASDAA